MTFHSLNEIFNFLEQTREKLRARVAGLSERQMHLKNAENVWSIAEILEHLSLIETSLVNLIGKLLNQAEAASSAAKDFRAVSLAEKAQGMQGKKFIAPDFAQPRENLNISDSLEKLWQTRRMLSDWRSRLEKVDLESVSFPHPLLGSLNLGEWLAFVGTHELRHLSQINELYGLKEQRIFR